TTHGLFAFRARQESSRLDALVIGSPEASANPEILSVASLGPTDPLRSAWASFREANGSDWQVTLDRRTGAPLLAQGRGIPWIGPPGAALPSASGVTVASLAASFRALVAARPELFAANEGEMALRLEGSVPLTPEIWQIEFDHLVSGIPVTGDRYVFYVS